MRYLRRRHPKLVRILLYPFLLFIFCLPWMYLLAALGINFEPSSQKNPEATQESESGKSYNPDTTSQAQKSYERFRTIAENENFCSNRKDLFILTVVHSAPSNYQRRMLIRKTWGSLHFYSQLKTLVLFAIGGTTNSTLQKAIDLETNTYKDILQEDFIDSYKNLTLKGLMWLRWASVKCTHASYVLKVDDDIFVNIFNMVTHLHNYFKRGLAKTNSIICLLWTRMPVMRDTKSKWYISKEEYAPDYFTTYCSGSAYTISGDLIPKLYQASLTTKFFWVDDFYITGLLPKKFNVSYHSITSLYVLKQQEIQSRVVDGYAIFAHIPGSNTLNKRAEIWRAILKARGLETELSDI